MSTLTSTDMGELKRPSTRLQQDTKMESPRAALVPPIPTTVETATNAPERTVRVALVKTRSDAELVDRLMQNCFEKLEGQSVSSETFTVASLEHLPYAANKLTEFGGFDGVICCGFVNTQDPQFAALSTALTQSFIDISVKNVRPVVRAVFVGEPRVASVRVKGGWGAEIANGMVSSINLGGLKGSK
ncbi:unnamed protein product [Peronospora destructor]|uniref:6,7-dimethyl-8-ribityllumazine synthase n=1 Tax=Peronospora destructor TaxID=86335 RepID=A0AAV0VF71_9STRA|nr:unnamed protein product [Peronospora destructor]